MPSTDQLRERLVQKLQELFQLDQPDLDFGFYRIMHLKAAEITQFLETDLLKTIADTFADSGKQKSQSAVEAAKEALLGALGAAALAEDGSLNPQFASTPLGLAYQEALDQAGDHLASLSDEGQIYEHLYRFFERYYEGGDFLSRRYHTRETPGQAAPYAIPYSGEEVKLHWANADQYYIKTSEHFSNYSFDLIQGLALLEKDAIKKDLFTGDLTLPEKLPVHFQIADASEGTHGNVKESGDSKRHFFLHEEQPLSFNEDGELILFFQYRTAGTDELDYDIDPLRIYQHTKNAPTTAAGYKANRETALAHTILTQLDESDHKRAKLYRHALSAHAPVEKINQRPVLAKYLYQYFSKNSMDYFIHKDLGTFLQRELDFYIKNEIMRLDDLTSDTATAPAVEDYLAKVKCLRKIAQKIITFLAQLENFQKKLWLKKKLVTETQYALTLDRIPEEIRSELYLEIIANSAQREEWIQLYAIDEIKAVEGDLAKKGTVAYSNPLTPEFLAQNPHLVLDTAHFSAEFKEKLLNGIPDLDDSLDGLTIHSENFQALRLLQKKYHSQLKCIYIDPPYNTNSTPILYKNGYKSSSWNSLIADRFTETFPLLQKKGVLVTAIDDAEVDNLSKILSDYNEFYKTTKVTITTNPKGSITKDFNRVHDYALFTVPRSFSCIGRNLQENDTPRKMRRWGENSLRIERRESFYPIYVKNGKVVKIGEKPKDDFHPEGKNTKHEELIAIWPIDQNGIERRWNFGLDSISENLDRIMCVENDGELDLFVSHELKVPKTVWTGGDYDAGNHGNSLLIDILGPPKKFDFPKSIHTVVESIAAATDLDSAALVCDYFPGSGTTGHAVINLNREDEGKRKYILVEMGDHFDTVLLPRLKKVAYSTDWEKGKPTTRDSGISHAFKYLRLESYEDTLNNLDFRADSTEVVGQNPQLKEAYYLNNLLNHGTKESALTVENFTDPTAYRMRIKQPGSDALAEQPIDLIETFSYLLGLRILNLGAPQSFTADFDRPQDPDLPAGQEGKLQLKGRLKQDSSGKGPFWFRAITGWVPRDSAIPDQETRNEKPENQEKVLIIWRKLTGDLEQDNLVLEEYCRRSDIRPLEGEYHTIYINGSNNLPNLKKEGDQWKVALIEEHFTKLMWAVSE